MNINIDKAINVKQLKLVFMFTFVSGFVLFVLSVCIAVKEKDHAEQNFTFIGWIPEYWSYFCIFEKFIHNYETFFQICFKRNFLRLLLSITLLPFSIDQADSMSTSSLNFELTTNSIKYVCQSGKRSNN
jgi:hypothetical protein